MRYVCPVCGWPGLSEDPRPDNSTHEICPSCGVQFGYGADVIDPPARWLYLREQWKQRGMAWWSRAADKPGGWDAAAQLAALEDMERNDALE
jgi:hypothetical protein